jgi:hypothetical protein
MDADDVSLPSRLEEQVRCFQNHPDAVVVSCDHYSWDGQQKTLTPNPYHSDELKSILLFATCFCHPTVMMKNSFKEKKCWYNPNAKHVEDYQLWTDLAMHGNFYNVNKPLLLYRTHPQQISVLHHQTQLANSSTIRANYLKQLHFSFTPEQLQIHDAIGNNIFFKELSQLVKAERWLSILLEQNKISKKIEPTAFHTIIHKFWMDSCGHSCLGLKAFQLYRTSTITSTFKKKSKMTYIKLLGKLMIRRFRK